MSSTRCQKHNVLALAGERPYLLSGRSWMLRGFTRTSARTPDSSVRSAAAQARTRIGTSVAARHQPVTRATTGRSGINRARREGDRQPATPIEPG